LYVFGRGGGERWQKWGGGRKDPSLVGGGGKNEGKYKFEAWNRSKNRWIEKEGTERLGTLTGSWLGYGGREKEPG